MSTVRGSRLSLVSNTDIDVLRFVDLIFDFCTPDTELLKVCGTKTVTFPFVRSIDRSTKSKVRL